MAYAVVYGAENRIDFWSKEDLRCPGCVQFDNYEDIHKYFQGELEDFRVIDGQVIFDPTPQRKKEIENQKASEELRKQIESTPSRVGSLESTQIETDEALCSLYEMIVGETIEN